MRSTTTTCSEQADVEQHKLDTNPVESQIGRDVDEKEENND